MRRSGTPVCLALVLLLCMLRTLLPEAWVLALHPHAHTTEEVAQSATTSQRHYLTLPHRHCHAEQFYTVPFVGGEAVQLPAPRRQPTYRRLAVAAVRAGQPRVAGQLVLRGPPAA